MQVGYEKVRLLTNVTLYLGMIDTRQGRNCYGTPIGNHTRSIE